MKKKTNKATPPALREPDPFHLRNHYALDKELFHRQPTGKTALLSLRDHDLVKDVGSFYLFRIPEKMNPQTARALPDPQENEKIAQWQIGIATNCFPARHGVEATARQACDAIADLSARGENMFLANIASKALVALATKARCGDGESLMRFAGVAVQAAEGLSQIVVAMPESVRPIAENLTRWPLMKSTHPLNCDSDQLLTKIGLGTALPLCNDRHAKWKCDHAARVAFDLFEHVDFMRREKPLCKFSDGDYDLRKSLPPFSQDSAPAWWKFAKAILLYSYPDPSKVSELAKICTTASRRKSAGRMKEQILSKIEARFLHMAAYPS